MLSESSSNQGHGCGRRARPTEQTHDDRSNVGRTIHFSNITRKSILNDLSSESTIVIQQLHSYINITTL